MYDNILIKGNVTSSSIFRLLKHLSKPIVRLYVLKITCENSFYVLANFIIMIQSCIQVLALIKSLKHISNQKILNVTLVDFIWSWDCSWYKPQWILAIRYNLMTKRGLLNSVQILNKNHNKTSNLNTATRSNRF